MFEYLIEAFPEVYEYIHQYSHLWKEEIIPKRTIILDEGKISNTLYFIEKGSARLFSIYNDKEINVQFFFENSFIASIESYLQNTPSVFLIETIDECKILKINKHDLEFLLTKFPALKEMLQDIISKRLSSYIHHFMTHIQLKPVDRYRKLLEEDPQVIQRVPLQHLASYLGVTTVSLSRIRARDL